MISFADFRRGGGLRAPLTYLNAVTARAEIGLTAFEFHRRMRTKTPLRVWTFKAAKCEAPIMDVDTATSEPVQDHKGFTETLTAFVAESGPNAEIICFPVAADVDPHLPGFHTTTAPNGDVWLARDSVTPIELQDYLRWDYGLSRV